MLKLREEERKAVMKEIPNEYANQFKSFEEFKEFMSDKARKQLVNAFNKTDLKNWKNEKHN